MSKFLCAQCGVELDADVVFCYNCGARVVRAQEAAAVVQADPQPEKPVEPAAAQYPPQPVQPVPFPAPRPEKPRTGGVWRAVLASVLAVLLTVFALAAGILGTVHTCISPDGLADTVRSVELSEIDISDFVEDADVGDTVVDYVYDVIDEDFIRDTGMKKRDVEAILDDPDLRDSLAGILSDYADAILNDERGKVLDGDDILELIQENEDLIESTIGYRLQRQDYSLIEEELDAFDFDEIAPKAVKKAIEDNSHVKLDTIRFGLSATPWIIAALLAVAMGVLIGLVYLFRIRPLLGFCGGGLVASGTLLLLVALGGALLPGILQLSFVSALTKPLVGTLLFHGLGQLVVGTVCAVIAGVLKPKKA